MEEDTDTELPGPESEVEEDQELPDLVEEDDEEQARPFLPNEEEILEEAGQMGTVISNLMTSCPICETGMPMMDLMPHITLYHPTFFMLWSSYLYPTLNSQDLYSITSTVLEEEQDEYSYEYLSELCESIGMHYVGLTKEQIDEVAPCRFAYSLEDQTTTCPICLEALMEQVIIRTPRPCGHTHCSECLEKWLSMHKTCPVCKGHLEPKERNEQEDAAVVLDGVDV